MKPFRILLVGTLLAFSAGVQVESSAREMSRSEIKSMPITERPSRPGHFYGNSVRRAQNRRTR